MSLYDLLHANQEKDDEKIHGVMIAIVTNLQDPESMGRVKVTYPWQKSGAESYWARIATLMAGSDRGSYFLPEVGDEVLVAFENGDLNHPFVIGALWNGKDKPPEKNGDGKNHIRKLKSRSGHEIVFDDEGGKEKVTLHSQAGHTVLLDDASGSEKIQIQDKTGSNTIIIDSTQNSITIESTMNFKIKSQMIELEADSMMTLKAGATLTIQGALVKIN